MIKIPIAKECAQFALKYNKLAKTGKGSWRSFEPRIFKLLREKIEQENVDITQCKTLIKALRTYYRKIHPVKSKVFLSLNNETIDYLVLWCCNCGSNNVSYGLETFLDHEIQQITSNNLRQEWNELKQHTHLVER